MRSRRDCSAWGEGGKGGGGGGRGGWTTQDSMIWRSYSYHYEDDLLLWQQPCTSTERHPKEGEVSFFEMLVPIYMQTHSVPHTRVHSSTPITEVVLWSDFLVPISQTTRRHISDDTNPYLKPGVVYVCMYVCMCVCVCVWASLCVLWDFRLQQRWSWDLRYSWVLYGVGWYPVTDNSGQPVKQYGLLDCWRWNQ